MEPREYKERFCMTHGGWCHDIGNFVRVEKILKGGKLNVRLECPNCAEKRRERAAALKEKSA